MMYGWKIKAPNAEFITLSADFAEYHEEHHSDWSDVSIVTWDYGEKEK